MTLALVRHGESVKNLDRVHGRASGRLTELGIKQMQQAAEALASNGSRFTRLFYAETEQCRDSASVIEDLLSPATASSVGIDPYDLGGIAGLADDEVADIYPELAHQLELFRCGLLPAGSLNIPDGETVGHWQSRFLAWYDAALPHLDGAILVLSRSLMLALVERLRGNTDFRLMHDWAMPNGGLMLWHREGEKWETPNSLDRRQSWPHTSTGESDEYPTSVITRFHGALLRRRPTVVIVPGLFSSSRHGPYNLYSRLAFAISALGPDVLTYDPPGSGDATPVPRDFRYDVGALLALAPLLDGSGALIISHSAGLAVAAAGIRAGMSAEGVIAIAPVTRRRQAIRAIRDRHDLHTLEAPLGIRSGVRYMTDYFDNLSEYNVPVDTLILAGNDQYVKEEEALMDIAASSIHYIPSADHAITGSLAQERLSELVCREVVRKTRHSLRGQKL